MTPLSAHAPQLAARLRDTPLAPFITDYLQHLITAGYTERTQQQYLGGIAHFAHWMTLEAISLDDVSPNLINRFIDEHLPTCPCNGRVQRKPSQVRAALRQLLPVLREAGHVTNPAEVLDDLEVELGLYDAHMREQRGLAASTRTRRCGIVGDLLRHALSKHRQPRPINVKMLRSFMAERHERWSPASCASMAVALRGYLRYRALQGDDVGALLPVIVSPAQWKLAPLPDTLSEDEIERVLGSFGPPLPSRLRGAAVAQCVARLGLRSAEVVGLELEDLDWTAATVRLHRCKSRRVDQLPMPDAVGAAIAAYLRHERPVCRSRRVFVRHVAPVEKPLKPGLVKQVIQGAYRRCELPYTRVHIFRHSLAARILDGGGTLKEVADVLRHRNLDTTQIYAKLDERRLSAVAMPWPESAL